MKNRTYNHLSISKNQDERQIFSEFDISALVVLIGATLYSIGMIIISYLKYSRFLYKDFDLAIDAQSIWNISHGSIYSSIHGIAFLGNHMRMILFLIAPFYKLFPSPIFLLTLQSLALAIGAWGIYILAKLEVPKPWPMILALIYLIYPPLIYLNLYEFHPIAFTVPSLIFMFYSYKTNKFKQFVLFMLLAMACQENIAFIILAFSAYALLNKSDWKWILTPAFMGLLYTGIVFPFIIPHFNNNTIQFYKIYGNLGNSLSEIACKIIFHPFNTLSLLLTARNWSYINTLLIPTAYTSLASPLTFIPAIPILLQRCLSLRPSETTILYHYQAELIPFVFISAIYGTKRILSMRKEIYTLILKILLLTFPILSFACMGTIQTLTQPFATTHSQTKITQWKDRVIKTIPQDASVLATFEFLPKLSNRDNLYSFHHVYSGKYTLSDKTYITPANIDFIIMNVNDPLTFSKDGFYNINNYKNLQPLLNRGNWQIRDQFEGSIILQLDKTNNEPSTLPARFTDPPNNLNTSVQQTGASDIQLTGFNIKRISKDKTALTLYWVKASQNNTDYEAEAVLSCQGFRRQIHIVPGSRILPPQAWSKNSIIADMHILNIPEDINEKTASITIRIKPIE